MTSKKSLHGSIMEAERLLSKAVSQVSKDILHRRSLWALDPLFEADAICIGSLPGTPCLEEVIVSFGCSSWETYKMGLSELEDMVDSIKRYNGDGSLTIDYRPINNIVKAIKRAAKPLAEKHGMSVKVQAQILPYSDTPGHMGGLLFIGTCVPGSYEWSALAYRIAVLHGILASEGVRVLDPPEAHMQIVRSPFSPIYKPLKCYSLKILETEPPARGQDGPTIREYLSDYTISVEDSELYPADPDSEERLQLEKLLPHYALGWACNEEAVRALESAGYKVARRSKRLVHLTGRSARLIIRCSKSSDRVELAGGDIKGLHDAIKILLDSWVRSRADIPETFKEAYLKARKPSEILEVTLELQEHENS